MKLKQDGVNCEKKKRKAYTVNMGKLHPKLIVVGGSVLMPRTARMQCQNLIPVLYYFHGARAVGNSLSYYLSHLPQKAEGNGGYKRYQSVKLSDVAIIPSSSDSSVEKANSK
jgi:hypothetical protein